MRRGVVVGEEWPSDLRVVEPDSDDGSGENHMLAGEHVSRTGTMDRVCMRSTRGVSKEGRQDMLKRFG